MNALPAELGVHRAAAADSVAVGAIVGEYCDAIGIARVDSAELDRYMDAGAGMWIARDGQVAIGCVAFRPLPERENVGEIKRLYVRAAYRGKGVADRLMDALESFAAAGRYRSIVLDSRDDLQAAIRFYTRRGFAPCERYNDNPEATVFMRKALSAALAG